MPDSVIFMFSGQGSQYYHMGFELFQKHETFRFWMLRLDNIVAKAIGQSIVGILYAGDKKISDPFERLLHTALALFMVEYSLAMTLIERKIHPDFVLGASFGEFTAAAVSEAITVEELLASILKHVKIVEQKCATGGMLAVLHDKKLYYDHAALNERSQLASINFHSHFVVSGTKDNLKEIENFLKGKEIAYQILPISYPFHSSLVDPVRQEHCAFLKNLNIGRPRIPIISCADAGVLNEFEYRHFWDVVRKPVLFEATINFTESQGEHFYIDLGPSGTLAYFIKYHLGGRSRSESAAIMTPLGKDLLKLEKICSLS
jgi:bacillaene synthase trans-acting acyltransferase